MTGIISCGAGTINQARSDGITGVEGTGHKTTTGSVQHTRGVDESLHYIYPADILCTNYTSSFLKLARQRFFGAFDREAGQGGWVGSQVGVGFKGCVECSVNNLNFHPQQW